MATLTTAYDVAVDPLSVKISWVAPYDNSEPIDAFEVLIRTSDSTTYSAVPSPCATTLALFCFVPLSTLRTTPFSLSRNNLVVVKARAHNQFGYGDYSEPNTAGATVQTEPDQITTITLDIATSHNTQIVLNWPALVDDATGDSAILSYHLQWDQAGGTILYDLRG
jgi:hypothetical protein